MAVTLTRPGKTIYAPDNKVSKYLAVNPNECIFQFWRKDYTWDSIIDSSGYAAIVVSGNITTELNEGDGIYFSSRAYLTTEATISSYSYSSGDDETTIVTDVAYIGTDQSNPLSLFYINLLDGRKNFEISVKIFNADSFAPIVSIPARTPFKSGVLNFDISGILRSQLSLEPTIIYTNPNTANTTGSLPFFIEYTITYDNATDTDPISDYPNIFTAVNAAQQIQDEHGSNLGEYVCWDWPGGPASDLGLFMTDFETPVYWPGYPFALGYCFQDEMNQVLQMSRKEQLLDENQQALSTVTTTMSTTGTFFQNHITLSGSFADSVKYVKLWIDLSSTQDYCNLTAFGQAFDFEDWVLDGNGQLLGVYVNKNDSIIASIDSRPNGKLYNPNGDEVDDMIWDAVDGRYEPDGYNHIINTLGWYVVINGISVTMESGYNDNVCPSVTFYQYNSIAGNAAPTANSLAILGTLTEGETINGSYNYADAEGDLQHVGNTVVGFYTYTDADGTLNETLVSSTTSLVLGASHVGKYIRFKVTPAAQTGTTPGLTYATELYGPVVGLEGFTFYTDFDPATDGTFDPAITYSGLDAPIWVFEDASQVTGASISVTNANGLDGTIQTVILKVQDLSLITALVFNDDHLVGDFDVTDLTGLTSLDVRTNALTSISGLNASQTFTSFLIATNSISTAPDFSLPTWSSCNFQAATNNFASFTPFKSGSTFTRMTFNANTALTSANLTNCTFSGSNEINFNNCTSLASISLGASAGTIGQFYASVTALTSINFTNLQVTQQIQLRNNTSLTSVNYGSQTGTLTQILVDNCTSLSGSQDFSGFSNLPGYLLFDSSPITDITLPNGASNTMTVGIVAEGCALNTITNLATCTAISDVNNFDLDVRNNGMTTAQVNQILVDFDTASNGGYTGRTCQIETNSAPDSGPPDGLSAAASLTSKSFTVTTD